MKKYTCEKCLWIEEQPDTYHQNVFQGAIEAHTKYFCKNKETSYKQKLIDLLKSDEQTKTAMEQLEFGCIIKNTINNKLLRFVGYEKYLDDKTYCFHFSNLEIEKESFSSKYETKNKQLKGKKDNFLHIIGLPLSERFIRMYCENNFYNNIDKIIEGFSGEKQDEARYVNFCLDETFAELEDLLSKQDNTKDFDNQSEEVYQRIYEALLELKK